MGYNQQYKKLEKVFKYLGDPSPLLHYSNMMYRNNKTKKPKNLKKEKNVLFRNNQLLDWHVKKRTDRNGNKTVPI